MRITHDGVEHPAGEKLAAIIGHEVLEELERVGSLHVRLAHMAYVKQPAARAHGLVLLEDAPVLHRHVPARKVHHAAAVLPVEGVERCGLGSTHAATKWRAPEPGKETLPSGRGLAGSVPDVKFEQVVLLGGRARLPTGREWPERLTAAPRSRHHRIARRLGC